MYIVVGISILHFNMHVFYQGQKKNNNKNRNRLKYTITTSSKHGNWPNKSIAIAIEILAQKCIAIVIMHYFY